MRKIIVTDTHFGVHNNSVTWLNAQLRVFYEQILTHDNSECQLIHCGDLFESRSAINPLIYNAVDKLIKDLSGSFKEVIIIGGNHDYYSPVEAEYNINSLDMLHLPNNVHVFTQMMYVDGADLYVPWYQFLHSDSLRECIEASGAKRVFCHTDLYSLDAEYLDILSDVTVYSGHIHTPGVLPRNHTVHYNLGSTYALSFTDCNSTRGYYILDDDDDAPRFVENTTCIHYWRLYDEDIVNLERNLGKDDVVELYMSVENIDKDKYIHAVNEWKEKYNSTLILRRNYKDQEINIESYDIERACDDMIPEHLKEIYRSVKERYHEHYTQYKRAEAEEERPV